MQKERRELEIQIYSNPTGCLSFFNDSPVEDALGFTGTDLSGLHNLKLLSARKMEIREKKRIIHRGENFMELPVDLFYQEMIFLKYLKSCQMTVKQFIMNKTVENYHLNVFYQKLAIS